MNMKALKSVCVGMLILGLTSCSQKIEPEVTTPAKPVAPKSKPVKPTPEPVKNTGPQTHKVGVLLPLSGPQADLGKGMLQAAELALFETGTTNVTLIPQDTNKGAQVAAQKALDQGAELLLGPLFAADVQAVKPLARGRNVSIVSFSTDQTIAGQGAYVLGFLPSQQIQRVTSYAKEKGQTKVAAFTPNDQYGRLVDQTLKTLASNGSIHLLGITHYTRGDILEGNPGNALLLEEMTAYKSKGVEAVIIPEGGENLAHLMRLLSPQKPFTVLGSGQWDAPETRRVPGLDGGIFASTDTLERQSFESRFRQAYGRTPPRLATLAYDATALAIALSDKGYTPQNLTFSQGFSGVDGLFRLTPQGLNERGLSILEVNATGFKTISAAPNAF